MNNFNLYNGEIGLGTWNCDNNCIAQNIESALGNKKLRIINIRRNEAALKAIGLDTNELTTIARGDKAPLIANKSSNGNKTKKKRRIPKFPTRFSTRLRNIPAVN